MPAYHSAMDISNCKSIGKVPILPLRITAKGTNARGPAPTPLKKDEPDIVDESLDLFKANILFTTFEIKERADLVLVYCMLYIILCLKRIQKAASKDRAVQDMFSLAIESFAVPGYKIIWVKD